MKLSQFKSVVCMYIHQPFKLKQMGDGTCTQVLCTQDHVDNCKCW